MSSQQMDSLEGGHFTSVAPGPGVVAQPPTPDQWMLTHGQETHKSVVTGRRHYPQMVRLVSAVSVMNYRKVES
jgi:hypothetical protein